MKFASRELTNQQVLDRIREVVTARFQAVEQEFKNADCARANVVSKEDFRGICHRQFMLLTDQQVRYCFILTANVNKCHFFLLHNWRYLPNWST